MKMNDEIEAAAEKHPKLSVIDWNVYSRSHPDWFQDDGLHLRGVGAQAMAGLIHKKLVDAGVAVPPVVVKTAHAPRRAAWQVVPARLQAAARARVRTPGRSPAGFHSGLHLRADRRPLGSRRARPGAVHVDRPGEGRRRPDRHPQARATPPLERRERALPDRHLRGLLPDRPAGVVGADAAPARVAASGSCSRATSSTRGGTGGSSSCSPPRPSSTTSSPSRSTAPSRSRARKALLAARGGVRPRAARLLQVHELLPQLRRQRARQWSWIDLDRERDAARRHLLLHVHGDLVRRRHVPRRARARPRSRASRSSRRSSRTSSPARSCARASCSRSSSAARPAPGRRRARVLPDRQRPLPEGRDREPPRDAHRRRRLRRAEPPLVARGAGRRSTATRSRSSPTSAATRTSRSASRCCSASSSRRTSRRRTRRSRCRTSGAAGT